MKNGTFMGTTLFRKSRNVLFGNGSRVVNISGLSWIPVPDVKVCLECFTIV